jgi:hypothetical protein
MAHQVHDAHDDHAHGPDCGHEAVSHGDHVDYLHDGHRHRLHDGHWDECGEGTDSAAEDQVRATQG